MMKVIYADNATDGIQKLCENPDVQIALIDIMMPNIDGFEMIRRIRSMPQFSTLPVIALTAKAMKGDREACLKAGATDYIAKPAEPENLMSLLRVHIARRAL
jgi:CheY-like chemotaxis protein